MSWSPDGRWIAFASRTQDTRYTEKDVVWQAPRKVERLLSRLNGEDWVFDRPSARVRRRRRRHRAAAQPDTRGVPARRRRVASPTRRRSITGRPRTTPGTPTSRRPLRHPARRGRSRPRRLTAHDGSYHTPSVSPDGTQVAFIGYADTLLFPQNAMVGVVPVDADGADEIVWASAGTRPHVRVGQRDRRPRLGGRRTLLAIADDRGSTHVYRVSADGSAPPAPVTERRRHGRPACRPPADTIATTRTTDAAPGRAVRRRRTAHPRRRRARVDAAPVRAVRRPDDRRHRRDRLLDRAPRRTSTSRAVPGTAQRARRPVRPVRRVLLRRGPDAGRRRVRRRVRQPARRQRAAHRLGAGDPRTEAPGSPRQRLGARSTSTTCWRSSTARSSATRSATAIASGCSAAPTAGTWRPGSPPTTATASARSVRSGRSTTCCPSSGRRHRHGVQERTRSDPRRRPGRVHEARRRSPTSTRSTRRC